MAILGQLPTFSGKHTLTHLGPRLLLNFEHKVIVFSQRDDPLSPQPKLSSPHQNQDPTLSWGREPPPSLSKLYRDADCLLAQPADPLGEWDRLARCVLTLHLPVSTSTPSRPGLLRTQTLPPTTGAEGVDLSLSITYKPTSNSFLLLCLNQTPLI